MAQKKAKKPVRKEPAKIAIKKKPIKRTIKKAVKAPKFKEIKIDLSTLKFCPECVSSNFFYSKTRDELICRDCGGIFSKLTPEQMAKYEGSLN